MRNILNNNNSAGKQITDVPLAHYCEVFAGANAGEMAARTGIVYDERKGHFELVLVGMKYYVKHDGKTIDPEYGFTAGAGGSALSPYEKILILRYLLEGIYVPAGKTDMSYTEMPWGAVYESQFRARVIGRIVRVFGEDPASLGRAVTAVSGLRYERLDAADAAYKFEFMNGFFISILIWAGDEEFPASAQVLFSDNFKYGFTAEDMAVALDIAVSRLKCI